MGNTGGNGDFNAWNPASRPLTLSGTARIGALSLHAEANNDDNRTLLTIDPNWSGSVDKLNLRARTETLEATVTWWAGHVVIDATPARIGQVTLGDFLSGMFGDIRPISETHVINTDGRLVVK